MHRLTRQEQWVLLAAAALLLTGFAVKVVRGSRLPGTPAAHHR